MPPARHTLDRPVLTNLQVRQLTLGGELHMWNTVRMRRAMMMRNPVWQNSSEAFKSAFLVGLAQIDGYRRTLRELLRDSFA